MAIRYSTGKNTSGPNQPPSRGVKDLVSDKPLEFPTFDPSKRYTPHIPLHPKLPIQIKIILCTKSFVVLHRKSLYIAFQIMKFIKSADTPEPISNLSVKFPLYTKFQDLVLLIEELNHSVRTRL